jgi:acyl carrier protein
VTVSRSELADVFAEAFHLPAGTDVENLAIGQSAEWDSIGHMALVAALEERCGITLDTDDIVEMDSFLKTIEILDRYGVRV